VSSVKKEIEIVHRYFVSSDNLNRNL